MAAFILVKQPSITYDTVLNLLSHMPIEHDGTFESQVAEHDGISLDTVYDAKCSCCRRLLKSVYFYPCVYGICDRFKNCFFFTFDFPTINK